MKNIILINIVTLFDYDHALTLLFKICKRTRHFIPKQLPFIQSNLLRIEQVVPKLYYRKQEHLYYDDEYKKLYLIHCFERGNSKQFIIKHSSQMKQYFNLHKQEYKCTQTKFDIRSVPVEIHIMDPAKAEMLLILAKVYFPHYQIELVLKNPIPEALYFFTQPQILVISTQSQVTIEPSLLSQIKQVKIEVDYQPFNLKFNNGPKLADNIKICFYFEELKNKVKSLNMNNFAQQYKDSIDFSLCEYRVHWNDANLQAANKLFTYLKNNHYALKGDILFELNDPENCPDSQHDLVKEYYPNFKFDELNIMSECFNLSLDLDEVRCNSLSIGGEEYELRLHQNYIVEKQLSLLILDAGEWFTEFVEDFEEYPDTLIMEILGDESMEQAAQYLQIIHTKKPDLKALKIVMKQQEVLPEKDFKKVYKAIGLFEHLEELEVPIYAKSQSLVDLLGKSISNKNRLHRVQLELYPENLQEKKIQKLADMTGFMKQMVKMDIRSIKCVNFSPTVNIKKEILESQKRIKLKGVVVQ